MGQGKKVKGGGGEGVFVGTILLFLKLLGKAWHVKGRQALLFGGSPVLLVVGTSVIEEERAEEKLTGSP